MKDHVGSGSFEMVESILLERLPTFKPSVSTSAIFHQNNLLCSITESLDAIKPSGHFDHPSLLRFCLPLGSLMRRAQQPHLGQG